MIKISTINRIYQPNQIRMVDIWDILTAIKTGVYNGENLISITQKIQQETNHDKQNDLKFHYLPCVLYNGVFSKKSDVGLLEYSHITAMDFDNFDSIETMRYIRVRLEATPCVIAVFVTPSGKGLKALVIHDNDNPAYHKELYKQLLKKFQIQDAVNDSSCCDLSRGNYICYDPTIWIRTENVVPYHFEHAPNHTTSHKTTSGVVDVVELKKKVETRFDSMAKVKSDSSIINIMNSAWRKKPELWMEGNRANSVFSMASQLCKFGVDIDAAIDYLKTAFTPVGLNDREIVYQAGRGYACNAAAFGSERSRFNNYGSKGKSKRRRRKTWI